VSYSKNNPNKKRKMWVQSQQGEFDLQNKQSKVKELSFAKTLFNIIQTLFDSGYKQKAGEQIPGMEDVVVDFDNGTTEYGRRTANEYIH